MYFLGNSVNPDSTLYSSLPLYQQEVMRVCNLFDFAKHLCPYCSHHYHSHHHQHNQIIIIIIIACAVFVIFGWRAKQDTHQTPCYLTENGRVDGGGEHLPFLKVVWSYWKHVDTLKPR